MCNEKLAVVYATDINYFKQTLVSIYSLITNLKNGYVDIFILVPLDFPRDLGINSVSNLLSDEKCNIHFISIDLKVPTDAISIKRITKPTYFRLLVPELLEEYDKCIYLDGDTLVVGNIMELFQEDVSDYYIGGVVGYYYYIDPEITRKRMELTDDENMVYINAGVMLMNLKAMRDDNMVESFVHLINRNFVVQDQDIVNYACKGKIKPLPRKYNRLTMYELWSNEDFLLTAGDLHIDNGETTIVIHYAEKTKPWHNAKIPFGRKWRSYCNAIFNDDKN